MKEKHSKMMQAFFPPYNDTWRKCGSKHFLFHHVFIESKNIDPPLDTIPWEWEYCIKVVKEEKYKNGIFQTWWGPLVLDLRYIHSLDMAHCSLVFDTSLHHTSFFALFNLHFFLLIATNDFQDPH